MSKYHHHLCLYKINREYLTCINSLLVPLNGRIAVDREATDQVLLPVLHPRLIVLREHVFVIAGLFVMVNFRVFFNCLV